MKKLFKNDTTGEIKEFEVENKYARVIKAADNSKWKAVPRPKTKSRADRRDDVLSDLNTVRDELENIKEQLETLEEAEEERKLAAEEKVEDGTITPIDALNVAVSDQIEEVSKEDLISDAQSLVEGIDYSEVESLQEELQSWMDNMSGTNLESTGKYSELEEAVNILQEAVDVLSSLSTTIEDASGVEEVINELDDAISNLESVEFPRMY